MKEEEEFSEFGFDDFRDNRDVEVILGRVVGDIPGSIEKGTKDLGLETLDTIGSTKLKKKHVY